MKGVLFSADFVEDNSGNYKLLELNTDTGFISSSINTNFDFTELKQVISDKNITSVDTIFKSFQTTLVDKIEEEVNGTSVTTFVRHLQDNNSIYPDSPDDASDKFIIRMAYDEGALFDTEYCKDRINVLTLFHENSDTGSIPAFYYSGSSQVYNTLIEEDLNDHAVLPDFVQKGVTTYGKKVQFYKGGSDVSSSVDRINDIVDNYLDKDNQSVEKLYYNTTQIASTDKVESIRVFYIAYFDDSQYKLIKLADYKIQSITELPTSIVTEQNGYNEVGKKHHHEFTTNWPGVGDLTGFNGSGEVFEENGTPKEFGNLVVNDRIKSFFISGSPETDEIGEFEAWSHDGNTLPDPSYVTSSFVENIMSSSLQTNVVGEIKIGANESLYSGLQQHFLVHEGVSNQFKFMRLVDLIPSQHQLVDHSGSRFDIIDTNILLIEEEDLMIYNPDVEEQDTYIVSASSPFIVHNAPCFIAGTKVHIEEKGMTNIEDVVVGDKVISYNHDIDVVEYKEVLQIRKQEDKNVVTYFFENGTQLTGTPDHPLFVIGKGYSSYYPKQTKEDSGLDVEQILLGDEALHMDGYGVTISDITEEEKKQTVYNLEEVTGNNNFFAEDFLVHNRACCFKGTSQVQMGNGSFKSIKDIEIGDVVQSFDEEFSAYTQNEVTAIHNSTKLSDHVLRNESVELSIGPDDTQPRGMGYFCINDDSDIMFTPEHPFLTKEGWKALSPDVTQEPFSSGTEPQILSESDEVWIEGDWSPVHQIDFHPCDEDEIVYNITVENTHTYSVAGIIVHNK